MPECLNVKTKKRGFTIIELLVAMAIFSLVVSLMVGMFVAAIRSQSKILTVQKLLDETSYSIEYMSRYIRMAVRDDVGECVQVPSPPACTAIPEYNYYNPYSDLYSVRFIDYGGETCRQFGLHEDGGKHELVEWSAALADPPADPPDCADMGDPISLTSKNLYLRNINFKLAGEKINDQKQPKVTILMEVGKGASEQPSFKIQTTISQRNLDF